MVDVIKDTYVVCIYVKKTVFGEGFRHLPGGVGFILVRVAPAVQSVAASYIGVYVS
jgi:hypothetical protein